MKFFLAGSLKIFGWILLALTGLWSSFQLLLILVNGYDCDISASFAVVVPSVLVAVAGIGLILLANKFLVKSFKFSLIFFGVVLLLQITTLVHASLYMKEDDCIDQTAGKDRFDYIWPGMTVEEVVRRVGKPKHIQACNWEFVRNDDPACEKSYVYASPLAPLVPIYPVIWLDKAGLVLKVYKYHSP